MWARGILSVVLLALVACRTPYQRGGLRGGYEDVQIKPGLYFITFSGNGFTSQAEVVAGWHRRAAEICGHVTAYEVLERDMVVRESEVGGGTSIVTQRVGRQSYTYAVNSPATKVEKPRMEGYIRCTELRTNDSSASPPVAEPMPPRHHAERANSNSRPRTGEMVAVIAPSTAAAAVAARVLETEGLQEASEGDATHILVVVRSPLDSPLARRYESYLDLMTAATSQDSLAKTHFHLYMYSRDADALELKWYRFEKVEVVPTVD